MSADFVGHGRTRIEDALGGLCVFLQGCAGDQGTGKWVAGTPWEDTVAMGERFATGVAEALATARAVGGEGLRVARSQLPLRLEPFPPPAELEAELARSATAGEFAAIVALGDALVIARRLEELRQASIVAVAIGPDLALVVLPGEVFLEHGLAVRRGSPFDETIVAAYNDNTLQYIPTRAAFSEGAYEVDGGWRYIMPGEGERMAAEAVRLLGRLRA